MCKEFKKILVTAIKMLLKKEKAKSDNMASEDIITTHKMKNNF